MNITSKRAGLLALAVTFSAGIHAALVPEHLKEMPPLGYAFTAAAVIGGALAWALVSRPSNRRVALLAGLFCLGQIVTWVLFVTVSVPGFFGTPEPVEAIALVSKAAELLGLVLALPIAIPLGHPRSIGRLSVSAALLARPGATARRLPRLAGAVREGRS